MYTFSFISHFFVFWHIHAHHHFFLFLPLPCLAFSSFFYVFYFYSLFLPLSDLKIWIPICFTSQNIWPTKFNDWKSPKLKKNIFTNSDCLVIKSTFKSSGFTDIWSVFLSLTQTHHTANQAQNKQLIFVYFMLKCSFNSQSDNKNKVELYFQYYFTSRQKYQY